MSCLYTRATFLTRRNAMKILVVEDDQDLLRLTETILRASGHKVTKAIDASQVLPTAKSRI